MSTSGQPEPHLGRAPIIAPSKEVPTGGFVHFQARDWYEIRSYDRMPSFFISVVSAFDHWLFASSSGGVSAGRIDPDHALLPYETEDRIALGIDTTGPFTAVRVEEGGLAQVWLPLSDRAPPVYEVERRILKSIEGDALYFEEVNTSLGLSFGYRWGFSEAYGLVRTAFLSDLRGEARHLHLMDGLRNVLPAGATEALQTRTSCLLDAYKRSERDPMTGVAAFSLSSKLTDRAEPSEALRANTLWTRGLDVEATLLTADHRVAAFLRGETVAGDQDVRGHRSAFLNVAQVELQPHGQQTWYLVGEVDQDGGQVGALRARLRDGSVGSLAADLEAEQEGQRMTLRRMVGAGDGLALSADPLTETHHFANTLFNLARGGVFVDGHRVRAADFSDFVKTRNLPVHQAKFAWLEALPETLSIDALHDRASREGADLYRLALEYLPLTWSRRHGDPSRPWNRFAINLRNDDGSARTDYQGNWRDIFQNWEPLVHAFPAFALPVVAKFLNATTPDGYNPYRVTRDGIEWEIPEPEDPWANIGYWGDHQIVYLHRLLEAADRFNPGVVERWWNERLFTYANVPYRIAPYKEMVVDPFDTITFQEGRHEAIEADVNAVGTDARLLLEGPVVEGAERIPVRHVTMMEKLLSLLLAKLTNLVPGAGIWMNTQRPEWNDANNALVGKGVSMVTAAYLRRFTDAWLGRLEGLASQDYDVSAAVGTLARELQQVLQTSPDAIRTDQERRKMMDALGEAGTRFRASVYDDPAAFAETSYSGADLIALLRAARSHLDAGLRARRRDDGLLHSYDVLVLEDNAARVEPLSVMLEGQVALLSSGVTTASEAVAILQALEKSDLFWPEQQTYLLYPNKVLPGFFDKNRFPMNKIQGSRLRAALAGNGDRRLVVEDPWDGSGRFGGDLRNAEDLGLLLDELARDPRYTSLVAKERSSYLDLFESVFDHRAFTGRSGTFFAYEGLGSVYWHMVSKLLLAVQERYLEAHAAGDPEAPELAERYFAIRAGLGFQKSPALFGAFPTDPYSHTPETGQARQPGMTGQVKEELMTRLGELGVEVRNGELGFRPTLLEASELSTVAGKFSYFDVAGEARSVNVPASGLAFTFCQVPVVYVPSADAPELRIRRRDGRTETVSGSSLDAQVSTEIFGRSGDVVAIEASVQLPV